MTDGSDRRSRWLRLLVPVLLLAAIAWWVDLGQVAAGLLSLSSGILVAALALATLDRGLMASKWWQLLRSTGSELRFSAALRIYYQASASGRLIPFPLGADVLRAYLASRERVDEGAAVSSIVIERLIAMLASVLLAGIGLVYLTQRLTGDLDRGLFHGLVGLGLALTLVALALVLLPPAHVLGRRIYGRLATWMPRARRLEGLFGSVSRSLLRYRGRGAALGVHVGLAILEQLLQYAKLGVLAYGVGIAVTWPSFFAIIAVTLFVRRIAGMVEQWGLGEGSAVVTFAALGIDPELAVALLIANFAVSTVAILPGVALFYTHPISMPVR